MYGIVVNHFEIAPSALLFMARNGHLKDGVWYWEGLQDPFTAASYLIDEEGEDMLRWDAARSGFYDTNPYYEGRRPYITYMGETLYIVDLDAPGIGGENLTPISR